MAIPLPSSGFRDAYRAGRATATPKRRRTPVLTIAGRAAAKAANLAARARGAVLSLGGFCSLDYAAFRFDTIAGFAAVGATLLVLEYLLTGGDG